MRRMLTGRNGATSIVVTLSQSFLDKVVASFGSSLLGGDVEIGEVSSDGKDGDAGDEEVGASC